MKPKYAHVALFAELKQWGQQQNSFSVIDFLKQKGISLDEFELIANNNKFMEIWGAAESQAWDNLLNALFTKSLPRSRIAEYIGASDVFKGEDPEEVIQSLEDGQFKLELYLTAIGDTDALKQYGRIGLKMSDTEALMRCSLERGMITQKEYEEIMGIPDDDEDD